MIDKPSYFWKFTCENVLPQLEFLYLSLSFASKIVELLLFLIMNEIFLVFLLYKTFIFRIYWLSDYDLKIFLFTFFLLSILSWFYLIQLLHSEFPGEIFTSCNNWLVAKSLQVFPAYILKIKLLWPSRPTILLSLENTMSKTLQSARELRIGVKWENKHWGTLGYG